MLCLIVLLGAFSDIKRIFAKRALTIGLIYYGKYKNLWSTSCSSNLDIWGNLLDCLKVLSNPAPIQKQSVIGNV